MKRALSLCLFMSMATPMAYAEFNVDLELQRQELLVRSRTFVKTTCTGATEGGTYGSKTFKAKNISMTYCSLAGTGQTGGEVGLPAILWPCDQSTGAAVTVSITYAGGKKGPEAEFSADDEIQYIADGGESGTSLILENPQGQAVSLDNVGEGAGGPTRALPNTWRLSGFFSPSENQKMKGHRCEEVEKSTMEIDAAEPEIIEGVVERVSPESDVYYLVTEEGQRVILEPSPYFENAAAGIRNNHKNTVSIEAHMYGTAQWGYHAIVDSVETLAVVIDEEAQAAISSGSDSSGGIADGAVRAAAELAEQEKNEEEADADEDADPRADMSDFEKQYSGFGKLDQPQ